MAYEIHDTHGAPQCGCEVLRFEWFYELEEYLEDNPDVEERIREDYAFIKEV